MNLANLRPVATQYVSPRAPANTARITCDAQKGRPCVRLSLKAEHRAYLDATRVELLINDEVIAIRKAEGRKTLALRPNGQVSSAILAHELGMRAGESFVLPATCIDGMVVLEIPADLRERISQMETAA